MNIRDRIKEFRRVPACELAPHPTNWRTHSKEQANALRGLLAEVGFAGAVLARELLDGTLQLIDGHLRTETVGADAMVPCLILDVNESEAAKILATYDPIGAMAGTDAATFEQLLQDVKFESQAVNDMLAELAGQVAVPVFQPASIDDQGKLDEKAKTTCPECGHEF